MLKQLKLLTKGIVALKQKCRKDTETTSTEVVVSGQTVIVQKKNNEDSTMKLENKESKKTRKMKGVAELKEDSIKG
ncbi:putative actin cytoskeleton-regulatory complex protein PAN1-like [Sesbania bispinosa]|nr:putative actin cytoskeleton-regulatory complex protein PAN1-like [Sesbania bispinosa]